MTSTANDTQSQQTDEAPLTWTSGKVWGSEGLTHRAATEINGETWKFTVDSPKKGQWVARAWRDGDFALYREDRTMKGAKEQAQTHANYAATQTCAECHEIGGHTLDCAAGLYAAMAKSAERGERIGLRAEVAEVPEQRAEVAEIGPAILKQLEPAQAEQLMTELEETFPHLAEWKRDVLGDRMKTTIAQFGEMAETMAARMGPAIVSANEAVSRMAAAVERVQAARDRVQMRKDTCGCRTPLHTMNCGTGGRVRVIRPAVSA